MIFLVYFWGGYPKKVPEGYFVPVSHALLYYKNMFFLCFE